MSSIKLSEAIKDLYLISGRVQNEDDDTVRVVEAIDLGHAAEKLVTTLQDSVHPDDYDEFASDEGPHVYLMINTPLESAIENRLVAESAKQAAESNLLKNLYLISGRVSGDDEDAAYIVEAESLDSAEIKFEDHMQTEAALAKGYSEKEKGGFEVIIVKNESLIASIQDRLIDNSPKDEASNEGDAPAL